MRARTQRDIRPAGERRRRSDGERSRRAILDASARLATVEGIDGLSIGRLAQAIGMSKSGLYAHFGSKEELQLATIDTAEEVYETDVIEPAMKLPDGLPRVEALCERFLTHIESGVFPGGCFFASVAAELDTRPGPVRDRIAAFQSRWSELIASGLRAGQRAGRARPGRERRAAHLRDQRAARPCQHGVRPLRRSHRVRPCSSRDRRAGRARQAHAMTGTCFGVPSASDPGALDAQVAFLGVPYDAGTPGVWLPKGQHGGPAAIRAASVDILSYPDGWYDVESDRDRLNGVTMADAGDAAVDGRDVESDHASIVHAVQRIAERGALMVALGGDHSISYPLVRGLESLGPFDVVHVDAHADFSDDLDGDRLTAAASCGAWRSCRSSGPSSAIGLRNVDRAEVNELREHGGRWATTRDVLKRDLPQWCTRPSPSPSGCTSRSTSTCSTRPSHRDTRCRSRAAWATRAARAAGRGDAARAGDRLRRGGAQPDRDPSGVTARTAAWIVVHLLSEIFDGEGGIRTLERG